MRVKSGFTGTQEGMSELQYQSLKYLYSYKTPFAEGHHGDCIGGDAQFHGLITGLGCLRVGHPPDNPNKRAYCMFDEIREEKPYLVRNHDIVDEVDVMFAAPLTMHEVLRSGTWATIRYALKCNKELYIVYRDGTWGNKLPD